MEHEKQTYKLGMSEEKAKLEFGILQKKLPALWPTIDHISADEQTIVVVPSISVDVSIPGPLLQAYEERFLFLLPNPRMRRLNFLLSDFQFPKS